MSLIRKRYNTIVRLKCEEYANELVKSGKKQEAADKLAKKKYKGTLSWTLLVQKKSLGVILEELKQIKAFEMDFSYLEPEEKEFNQLSGFVKKQRRKFSFINSADRFQLVKSIVSVVDNTPIDNGRIFGVDTDGTDRIIKIQDNPDNFGEYDYDDIASKINEMDVSLFNKSWVIHQLLNICSTNPATFKAKIKCE